MYALFSLIFGGGSAGLISAVTLKRLLPHLAVRVIRSEKVGVIGVSEGTVVTFREHFFNVLGMDPRSFYAVATPTDDDYGLLYIGAEPDMAALAKRRRPNT